MAIGSKGVPYGTTYYGGGGDRRGKISAISAVSVSPRRQRLGLYVHFHHENITGTEVAIFLRDLLRHLRGPIVLLWDGGTIHQGEEVQGILRQHPRLHGERFPSYAPELNPDEWVWRHLKQELANGRPDDVDELMDTLCQLTKESSKAKGADRIFRYRLRAASFLASLMSITYAQIHNKMESSRLRLQN